MSKKFVRKIIGVKDIQDLRDFTSEIGDIVIKDGIHAYIHVEDEYKPISYPMIWDYGVPKDKKSRSDKYVNKTGIHSKDTKYSTISKHDVTDGKIEGFENVADDPSMINALNTGRTYTIGNTYFNELIQSKKNIISWGLSGDSSFTGEMKIYDNDDNPITINTNVADGDIQFNTQSNTVNITSTFDERFYCKLLNNKTDVSSSIDLSENSALFNLTNSDGTGIIGTANDSNTEHDVSFMDTAIDDFVQNDLMYRNYSFRNKSNNIRFYIQSDYKGTTFAPEFHIDGTEEMVNGYREMMDSFLSITSRINDLQSQINNLSNRISSLEK